jgi:uncharacterized membrane protein
MVKKRNNKKRGDIKLLNKIKNDEKKLLKVAGSLKKEEMNIKKEEKKIIKEEKKIEALEKKILRDEKKILLAVGKLKIRKEHFFDFIRIVAGALLGTSLGRGFIKTDLATNLPWINIFGIFVLSFAISSLLVYKAERKTIAHIDNKYFYMFKRVIYIWIIAAVVSSLSSLLFMVDYPNKELFIKNMLINLYPAIAGAIGFSLI